MRSVFFGLSFALLLCFPLLVQAQEKVIIHKGKTLKEWTAETVGGTTASRLSAVVALGEIGAPATDALILVLGRKDPDVRQLAITFLGVTRGYDKKIVTALCQLLSDKKRTVREAASESLFNRGGTAKSVLHKNCGSRDTPTRIGAYLALSFMGYTDKKTVALLVKALSDKNPRISKLSMNAVKELGPKAEPAIPVLVKILHSLTRKSQQLAVLEVLERIGTKSIPELKKIAALPNSTLRAEASAAWKRLSKKRRFY